MRYMRVKSTPKKAELKSVPQARLDRCRSISSASQTRTARSTGEEARGAGRISRYDQRNLQLNRSTVAPERKK